MHKPGFVNIGLLMLLTIFACKDKSYTETDVIFMGHKGAGSDGYNDIHIENTIPAMQEGLSKLDGVETDIQQSLSGTIWLYHDADLTGDLCDTNVTSSIPLLSDSKISKFRLCNGGISDRFYKLSELFDLLKNTPGGFPISLDVKSDFSADVYNTLGDEQTYLFRLCDTLVNMLALLPHPENVYIESGNIEFLDRLKSKLPQATTSYLYASDFNIALNTAVSKGYKSVSCIYTCPTATFEAIQDAKSKGIKVQLWSPYYLPELQEAFQKYPTTIQTDNVDAKIFLKVK